MAMSIEFLPCFSLIRTTTHSNVNIYLIKNVQITCSWCLMLQQECIVANFWLFGYEREKAHFQGFKCFRDLHFQPRPAPPQTWLKTSPYLAHFFMNFSIQKVSYKFFLDTIVINSLPQNSENAELLFIQTLASLSQCFL